jgi:hypothetical protein
MPGSRVLSSLKLAAAGALALVVGTSAQGAQVPSPRPYAQVIPAAAKSDDGIFKVHRIGTQLLYEIPKTELGKDYLWNTQIKKASNNAWYG